jgi:hypothetical protein
VIAPDDKVSFLQRYLALQSWWDLRSSSDAVLSRSSLGLTILDNWSASTKRIVALRLLLVPSILLCRLSWDLKFFSLPSELFYCLPRYIFTLVQAIPTKMEIHSTSANRQANCGRQQEHSIRSEKSVLSLGVSWDSDLWTPTGWTFYDIWKICAWLWLRSHAVERRFCKTLVYMLKGVVTVAI